MGKNSHLIGVLNGRQSVGDSDGRASLGGLIKRSLHNLLGVGIQSGSSFVEEKDFGVAEQGSGDGDTF